MFQQPDFDVLTPRSVIGMLTTVSHIDDYRVCAVFYPTFYLLSTFHGVFRLKHPVALQKDLLRIVSIQAAANTEIDPRLRCRDHCL